MKFKTKKNTLDIISRRWRSNPSQYPFLCYSVVRRCTINHNTHTTHTPIPINLNTILFSPLPWALYITAPSLPFLKILFFLYLNLMAWFIVFLFCFLNTRQSRCWKGGFGGRVDERIYFLSFLLSSSFNVLGILVLSFLSFLLWLSLWMNDVKVFFDEFLFRFWIKQCVIISLFLVSKYEVWLILTCCRNVTALSDIKR